MPTDTAPDSLPLPTPASAPDLQATDATSHMDVAAFDELDAILDDLRSRYDETPQWEFCEGFMAALVCCRRTIAEAEYLAALLGLPMADEAAHAQERSTESAQPAGPETDDEQGSFASDAQRQRFLALWQQRWAEVSTALDAKVNSLEDDDCYHPEVMDIRAAVAEMPDSERAAFKGEELPAFAQVWALGFMYAVEYWPDDWQAPRDKTAAQTLDNALTAIVAMTEDDTSPPELSPLSDEGAPSTSLARLNAFGEAIWAVYDLRELWKALGPRIATVRAAAVPGRNDLCHCGSGKKYKKCHGAG